jgi:hypothetical protein
VETPPVGETAAWIRGLAVHPAFGRASPRDQILAGATPASHTRPNNQVHCRAAYSGLDEKDQAFAWLEKAYQERAERLVFLKVEPMYDSLRSDPRFVNLLPRIGLAP